MAGNNSSSFLKHVNDCTDSTIGIVISIIFVMTHVLLVAPLSLLVLYLGYQRWRQQRSFATMSHSDMFTYHTAVVELIFVLGEVGYMFCQFFGLSEWITVGVYVSSMYLPGQSSFHILTCVERYLAVVHPVMYLRLKQSRGFRIRNISIGCAWLLFCGWIGVQALYFPYLSYVPVCCLLVLSLTIVSFCSVSVLYVLIRPGPGETTGNRDRVDQFKHRAFHTIVAITLVVWLYFVGLFVCVSLKMYVLSYSDGCVVIISANWFMLPSSLVLPLLFLHRAGKLHCCYCSND